MRRHLPMLLCLIVVLASAVPADRASAQMSSCYGWCEPCTFHEGDQVFYDPAFGNVIPDGAACGFQCWWNEGYCDYNPTFAKRVESLGRLVASGQTEHVARLLESFKGAAYVNVGRQAIQVVGCRGRVIAHYPLTVHQLAFLSPAPRRYEVTLGW